MPSASSKSEKPASAEATDPLKQAIVIIEHKIKNLEKRKAKLDSYKESIKPLTKEQVEAISKYDEVVQQLELSKEYIKQFTLISVENNKLKKRQARKDALEKYLAEVNKVKQVLLIQDVLQHMSIETIREDFLDGKNGAVKLTQDDLKILDDLQLKVLPKRMSEDGKPFPDDQFKKSAEYFMGIIDGKPKEVAGSTGAKLKELFTSIFNSGYFDQPLVLEKKKAALAKAENKEPEGDKFHKNQEILSNVVVPPQNKPECNHLVNLPPVPNSLPVQPMLPGPILPGNHPPILQPNHPPIMPNVPNIIPTPVSQVESSFFSAQGFKPPAPPSVVPPLNQTTRHINDVLQSMTGKFSFLQESELDIAELNSGMPVNPPVAPPQMPTGPPPPIHTQTFTNQNFNNQPGAGPNFPPNFPPQPAPFPAFIPAFPAFVAPNATPVQNNNSNMSSANPTPVGPVNSVNSIPSSNSNILSSNNKSNNIPNSIPMAPNRNPNVSFNPGQQLQMPPGFPNHPITQTPSPQQQIPPGFPNTPITQSSCQQQQLASSFPNKPIMQTSSQQHPMPPGFPNQPITQSSSQPQQLPPGFPNQPNSQTSSQPVFSHGNVSVGTVDNVNNTVRKENEVKEKQEKEKKDWSGPESTNRADDSVDPSEWNRQNQNQSDGHPNGNKYSSGRPLRNTGGIPRNSNGYHGNRGRPVSIPHRQGGYRDSIGSNSGGSNNYYQNQNGYQSRNERNNEFSSGGKGNSDFRNGSFKDRGDFNKRDNELRDNHGFKRGPISRGPNMRNSVDRGDRQGQIQRNNPGGPRGPRNINRQPNSRTNFSRQQPNVVGQATTK